MERLDAPRPEPVALGPDSDGVQAEGVTAPEERHRSILLSHVEPVKGISLFLCVSVQKVIDGRLNAGEQQECGVDGLMRGGRSAHADTPRRKSSGAIGR